MIRAVCQRQESLRPDWSLLGAKKDLEVWPVIQVALLRDLGGLGWARISVILSSNVSTSVRRYQRHRVWLACEQEYGREVGELGSRCLAAAE